MDFVGPEIFHHFVGEFDFDGRFPIAKESEMAVVLGVDIFKFGSVEFGLAFSLLDFFVGSLGVFAGFLFLLLFLGFPLLLFLLLLFCFWLRSFLLYILYWFLALDHNLLPLLDLELSFNPCVCS